MPDTGVKTTAGSGTGIAMLGLIAGMKSPPGIHTRQTAVALLMFARRSSRILKPILVKGNSQ